MSSPSAPWLRSRPRRCLALVVAVAILLAGIAQAAHYHKADPARGTTDVHCLLCLFAGGTAGPPAIAAALTPAVRYSSYRFPSALVFPLTHHPVPYQARGPPLA
jgi:hypothetical protein